MHIFFTGATGLIGKHLTPFLLHHHKVTVLSRNKTKAHVLLGHNIDVVSTVDEVNFNHVDTVINLAGEPIIDKRWTDQQKRTDSHYFRFDTTELLRGTLLQQSEAFMIGRTGEWLSANDVRGFLDLNSVEGGDEYANPNVKSGGETPTGEPDDEPEEDDETEEDTETNGTQNSTISRPSIVSTLTRDIRQEGRNIVRYAETAKDFPKAVDDFYDRYTVTMYYSVEPIGGTENDVKQHCEWSKNRIFSIMEAFKPSELLPAITLEVGNWPSRAETIADTLIERLSHATQQ